MKSDILCVQEGPKQEQQVRNFLEDFVEGDWEVFGSDMSVSQRPYIVYRDFTGLNEVEEVDFIAPD